MKLVSEDVVEFRRVVSRDSSNGSGKNYYYHFEDDDNGAFQLWSKKEFGGIQKGDLVNLEFTTRLWDNRLNFDLSNIIKL